MTEEICQNCHWAIMSKSGKHAYCKRFPPSFTKNDENGYPRFFNPIVAPHSFCGEWEPRDE